LMAVTVVKLTPKKKFKLPVGAEAITPDRICGLSPGELKALPIWEGNRELSLGELFRVELDTSGEDSVTVLMRGDLRHVRGVGSGMSSGRVVIKGDIGMYVGEAMRGGVIQVHGHAGSWLGSAMRGGLIEVFGDAGDFAGAARRGLTSGMRGGEIRVHGCVGWECGCWMSGGLITVDGDVGLFGGIHMKGGVLLVRGGAEGRIGAEMTGGKIVVLGEVPSVLPSFTFEGVRGDTKVGGERLEGPFYMFLGDLAEGGEGRLYVSAACNPHLKFYERYLGG